MFSYYCRRLKRECVVIKWLKLDLHFFHSKVAKRLNHLHSKFADKIPRIPLSEELN